MVFLLRSIAEDTTFHGCAFLLRRSSITIKLLWSIFLAAAYFYCGFEVIQTFRLYSEHNVVTEVIDYELKEYPKMTICEDLYLPMDSDGANVHSEKCRGRQRDTYIQKWLGDNSFSEYYLAYHQPNQQHNKDLNIDAVMSLSTKDGQSDCFKEITGSLFENLLKNMLQTAEDRVFEHRYWVRDLPRRSVHEELSLNESSQITRLHDQSHHPGVHLCTSFTPHSNKTIKPEAYFSVYVEKGGVSVAVDGDLAWKTFRLDDDGIRLTLTATRREKVVECESPGVPVRELERSQMECVHELSQKTLRCCVCGYGFRCSPDLPCCLPHHAHSIFSSVERKDEFEQCHTERRSCVEMIFVATVKPLVIQDDLRDQHHTKDHSRLEIEFANPFNILYFRDFEALSFTDALSRAGGFLGLLIGGSALSILQIFFHLADEAVKRYKRSDSDIGTLA